MPLQHEPEIFDEKRIYSRDNKAIAGCGFSDAAMTCRRVGAHSRIATH
jgi:hypothetical protein